MKKKRVYVGMSGGIDSSVSATLLKQAGFEVIGVFIRVWEPSGFVCTWRQERREARRVAAHLDIPLITLDLSKEYKKKVVDYFISEYQAGRTPNPDVMCNKHIKFGVFYDWAMTHGADFVATGHYAQTLEAKPLGTSRFRLQVSADNNKDQTYFLWNIKHEQLAKILFPIGDKTKTEVRKLAKKFGLPNAEKKDSQGLCFIGKIDFKDFLKRELRPKKGRLNLPLGKVLNEAGKIIGQHDGAIFFTLGERRGFEIFSHQPNDKPYYIIAKDINKNTLTVSQMFDIQSRTLYKTVDIEQTNWLGELPDGGLEVKPLGTSRFNLQARVRYRQPLQKCQLAKIDPIKKTATIIFDEPQLAVSGQSLVLYDKDICLGGGVIE